MDASHLVHVEGAKDTSTHEEITGPKKVDRSSMSSDSMVSVRLSASGPYLAEVEAQRSNPTAAHYQTSLDNYAVEEPLDEQIHHSDRVGSASAVEDVSVEPHEYRASIASSSVPSFAEDGESVSTVRSRSNSSTTASSSNSTHVDWDELERSEEQEPRDEGSDEVRYTGPARLAWR